MANIEITKEFAACVRYHRKQAGLTQLELANLAGLGKTAVFDIEHAKLTIQLDSLLKVLAALNINLTMQSPLMQKYIEETKHEKS